MAYASLTGAGVMFVFAAYLQNPVLAMIAMGLSSFGNDLVMPGAWGACMDVGGKFAGSLSGSMNMMGNFAGFLAPTSCPDPGGRGRTLGTGLLGLRSYLSHRRTLVGLQ